MTDDLVNRAAALPVANIGDAMERLNVVDAQIGTVWPGARVAGRAFTVMTAGGDNKAIHEALTQIGPGDVLVVNGQGNTNRALIGELIAGRAIARGVAGFVIDGAVRDVRDLEELRFPVYARAVTPAGPYRNGPGYLQRPVAIGGVVVNPGDIVVGDDDGVAVLPQAEAADIIGRAEAKHEQETKQRAEIPGQPATRQ
jgi:RraA family protein